MKYTINKQINANKSKYKPIYVDLNVNVPPVVGLFFRIVCVNQILQIWDRLKSKKILKNLRKRKLK